MVSLATKCHSKEFRDAAFTAFDVSFGGYGFGGIPGDYTLRVSNIETK